MVSIVSTFIPLSKTLIKFRCFSERLVGPDIAVVRFDGATLGHLAFYGLFKHNTPDVAISVSVILVEAISPDFSLLKRQKNRILCFFWRPTALERYVGQSLFQHRLYPLDIRFIQLQITFSALRRRDVGGGALCSTAYIERANLKAPLTGGKHLHGFNRLYSREGTGLYISRSYAGSHYLVTPVNFPSRVEIRLLRLSPKSRNHLTLKLILLCSFSCFHKLASPDRQSDKPILYTSTFRPRLKC